MNLLQRVANTISPPKNAPSSDFAHITQEMYKKNFELAEKNRTLSLLRKIDEIILSTVTDVQEIAQHVADVVTSDAEFKAVFIFIYNKRSNELIRFGLSETELIKKLHMQFNHPIFREKILITKDHNIIEKAFNEKKTKIVDNLYDLLLPEISENARETINQVLQIKSVLIYPLIIRNEIIGTLIISSGETQENLFQYQRELIERLVDVIGIAVDNALLYQKIEDANQKLKQLDRLKDEFVSLASHELRTPMTVIKSYLWMTLAGKGGEITEKQKFYLDRAYKSTDRLITFVNEMLNVSRIESNRITIQMRPFKLDGLVQDITSEMEPRLHELQLAIIVTPYHDLPQVIGDQDKIREVITNLIGNSLKFTPSGGTITISFSTHDGFIQTNITDTGIGMSGEDLPKLFHKFGMVGENYLTKTNSQGTGLGLYITKSIVELHGGAVWAASEGKGKGSTFSFTLKIWQEDEGKTNFQNS